MTVTFGALKPGLLVDPGSRHAGVVELVDIGLAERCRAEPSVVALEAADVADAWPFPGPGDDKYSRGVLGVVAGSAPYPGAAVLCVGGALGPGAGMVRFVGDDAPAAAVHARWPEAVAGPGRVQAWVVGPGLGTDAHAADRVREVLASDVPVRQRAAVQAVLLEIEQHQSARKQQPENRFPAMGGGEQPRLVEQHQLVGFGPEQRDAGLAEHAGAVDRAILGGGLLHRSLGVGQNLQRIADERPAFAAWNVPQGLGIWRRRDGRGKHALHRHGNYSAAAGSEKKLMLKYMPVRAQCKIAFCRGAAKLPAARNSRHKAVWPC